MNDENTINDPGAELAIKLLDNAIGNGTDPVLAAIAEGVKASITVSCRNNNIVSAHIKDESVHTFLGIIKEKGVLKWVFGSIFGVSILVQYVPDLVKWFIGLF